MMNEDNIDSRIEKVIRSVASKKADMAKWKKQHNEAKMRHSIAVKRWRTYGISAAASVVIICSIGIGVYVNRHSNYDYHVNSSALIYRGGTLDIDAIKAMIDSGKYQDAIQAIHVSIADTVIDQSLTPERQEYIRALNKNRNYELTWLKIDILIKVNKVYEAKKLLQSYVNETGEHQQDAQKLLKSLEQ